MTSPARADAPATTSAPVRTRLGAALLVLGSAQFLVAHLVVQSAWVDPPYSWWTNYISDLGAVSCGPVLGNEVCSPLHAGMNASFVAQGVLLALGALLTAPAWSGPRRGRLWRAMVVVTGVSWVLVGLIPEDVSLVGHSVGALPVFLLGNVALVVAGASASTRERRAVRLWALGLGVLGLAGFVLTAMATSDPGGPIGVGAAERVTVFPLQVWAVVAGASVLRRPVARTSTSPTLQ